MSVRPLVAQSFDDGNHWSRALQTRDTISPRLWRLVCFPQSLAAFQLPALPVNVGPEEQQQDNVDMSQEVDLPVITVDFVQVEEQERHQHVGEGLHLAEPADETERQSGANASEGALHVVVRLLAYHKCCRRDQAEEVARLDAVPYRAQRHCQQRPVTNEDAFVIVGKFPVECKWYDELLCQEVLNVIRSNRKPTCNSADVPSKSYSYNQLYMDYATVLIIVVVTGPSIVVSAILL